MVTLLLARHTVASGEIHTERPLATPVTLQPGTSDLKAGDFGVVPFTDGQQFESLKVSIVKRATGVTVTTVITTDGSHGAGVGPSTAVIQLANAKNPLTATTPNITGISIFTPTATVQWQTPCHHTLSSTSTVDIPNVNFDDVNAVYLSPIVTADYAC